MTLSARRQPVTRLVERARSGDQTAWAELVDRFTPVVWSVIRVHRLGDADAADVFQLTWLRLLDSIDTLRDPESLAGWLATTARREALRLFRHAGRTTPADDTVFERIAVEDVVEDDEDRARTDVVRAALATLAPRDQALLRLLAVDPPLSYSEISVVLDMPRGSIGPTRAGPRPPPPLAGGAGRLTGLSRA